MPVIEKKFVRCPVVNKNLWIILEVEKDINGNEILLCMTCKKKDSLERLGQDCGVGCRNYFYPDD